MIALLLMVFGAVVVWILSRQLVRPLGDLTRAAEAMAGGSYAQRVEPRTDDEVGRLATAFNRMAHEVQVASDASEQALARLTKTADDQAFLAEASRILAGSLSDDTLLADLARHCVPRMADYCTIHVVDDNGAIRRIDTAHRDSALRPLVLDLVRRYEYRLDSPGDVPTVVRTQEPLLIPRIDLEAVASAAADADTRRLLHTVCPSSFMCVPLVARGRAFGAITFKKKKSGPEYGAEELEIASELARRTAVAIDNALIYRRSLALRLEAEAASSAKSDFLAKMSHEIRTPINAMMGYAELLQMGISGPVTEAQAKQLARIRSSGDHLTSLVNEILDLAKIEAGRMAIQPGIAVAGDAADGALNLIRPLATTKGVELASHVDGDPQAEYFGDPQRVQQILTNLLSNAVKFTPAGGRVLVTAGVGRRPDGVTHEATPEWACITVADTGLGISPDNFERIFQPFVQAEAGYTRQHGGTGLGLTISRSLAQMMGGEITVESELGKGSRFTLWLPCPVRAIAAT
jgi:signal transduction histidine kinase